jgi:hypothetical protein
LRRRTRWLLLAKANEDYTTKLAQGRETELFEALAQLFDGL